ncbi:MAG: ankyrin repeat domain-containing protein [Candidatus Thiodiazotropha sp.]
MPYRDIQAADLKTLLQREDLVVIDMRDASYHAAGHLPNSQPVNDALIAALAKQRRQAPPVLVYCYHGNSSRDLCGLLAQFGLPELFNLTGGWSAWEAHQVASDIDIDINEAQQGVNDSSSHPHGRTVRGMTPLMTAALQGNLDKVNALLAAGADPRQLNEEQHHALWFACVNGDPRLVERLLDAGCEIDQRNINGITCAIYSASAGKLEALRVLVKAGADLTIRTPDGFDALDSASTLAVLRFLKPSAHQAV